MEPTKTPEKEKAAIAELKASEQATETAIRALQEGHPEAAKAEVRQAEKDLEKAEAKLEKSHSHKIEITVDGKVKHIENGIYFVNILKADVGVPADKELDIVKDGIFIPLADNAEIKIHPHEVFVSHARTGGSS